MSYTIVVSYNIDCLICICETAGVDDGRMNTMEWVWQVKQKTDYSSWLHYRFGVYPSIAMAVTMAMTMAMARTGIVMAIPNYGYG